MSVSSGSSQFGPFKSGQKSIDAGLLNRLWSGLDQNAPGKGNFGILHRQSGGGTTFSVIQPRRIPRSLAPFTVFIRNGKVRVHPGSVNNVIPKIAGVPLTQIPQPDLAIPAGTSSEWIVVVKCQGSKNERFPTQAEIVIVSPTEATKDTDEYGYLALASLFKVGAGWNVTQLISGSVWAERNKYTEPETAWYYFYRV